MLFRPRTAGRTLSHQRRKGEEERARGLERSKGRLRRGVQGFMEPEASKEAEKQPMEAEAGDPADPRDLGNLLNPPVFPL